jgi:hypothetical protein
MDTVENIQPEKKKRGRKPKPKPEVQEPYVPKKRGRKPKGGKILANPLEKSKESEYVTENVILHLKCNTEDINNDNDKIESHENNNMLYQVLDEISVSPNDNTDDDVMSVNIQEDMKESKEVATKRISEKIIDLQKTFYFNDIQTTNSACFWCTCDFNHTSIHIPKYKLNDVYHVYGCFCSPECAVAYLFKESIDSSVKYERYQLLNYLYNRIYDNISNIKPAPDPNYMLSKFMGNMNIEEYRELLRQDRLFIVVDKPITRILPEIYEEVDLKGSQIDLNNSKSAFQIKKNVFKSSKPSIFQ